MPKLQELQELTPYDFDTRNGNRQLSVAQPHKRLYTRQGVTSTEHFTKITVDGSEERSGRPTLRQVNFPGVMGFVYGNNQQIEVDVASGNQILGAIWQVDIGHLVIQELEELDVSELVNIIPTATGVANAFDLRGNLATYFFTNEKMTHGVTLRHFENEVALYTFESNPVEETEDE